VSLSRSGKGVKLETTFNNQAKDHRVRALFPTDLTAAVHHVDSMFEIATRDNTPAPEWQNPSNTQHQQSFVDVSEVQAGLVVANLGLNEYEVLEDGRNTIAVTLLRAVGELGDWGLFPTPEAQCLGEHSFQLEIIPHDGNGATSGAYIEAYQFQIPWTLAQTNVHPGFLTPSNTPFEWQGDGLAFSSLKVNEDSGDLMLRWYNMSSNTTELKFAASESIPQALEDAYQSNILEEEIGKLNASMINESSTASTSKEWALQAGPCEIVTVGLRR
jgi:alpha-mannosidase